jgi:hypothetical protein
MTHTYAVLELSAEAYEEIRRKLVTAGYDHAIREGEIDMHGIGVAVQKVPAAERQALPAGSDYRVAVPLNVQGTLKDLGRDIGRRLPDGWGFGLFLFHFGAGGTMTWISNAQRADMLAALQEFIGKQAS